MELFAFLVIGGVAALWGKLLLQALEVSRPQRKSTLHDTPAQMEQSLPATPEVVAEPPASTQQELPPPADCASSAPSGGCEPTQS